MTRRTCEKPTKRIAVVVVKMLWLLYADAVIIVKGLWS